MVKGHAKLRFRAPDGKETIFEMYTGDEITIYPHHPHRVESTSPNTIWVAIFWPS